MSIFYAGQYKRFILHHIQHIVCTALTDVDLHQLSQSVVVTQQGTECYMRGKGTDMKGESRRYKMNQRGGTRENKIKIEKLRGRDRKKKEEKGRGRKTHK